RPEGLVPDRSARCPRHGRPRPLPEKQGRRTPGASPSHCLVRSSLAWRCLMTQEANPPGPLLRGPRQAPTGVGETSAASVVPDDLPAPRAGVEGTAGGPGQEFFRSLVRHLAEAIAVPYASVCEFQTPPHGRALAFWERDHVVENLPFDFTTSPAAGVLSSDLV